MTVMTERTIQPRAGRAASRSSTRQLVARHPVATFLIACYALNWLVVLPLLRVRGGLPFQLGLWESLGSILGVALLAFLVVAASGGRAGVRDLAGRCLRWRVGVRWYLVALVAPPVALPLGAAVLFGAAPLRALFDQWALLPTGFLPRLLVGIVLFNVAEEIGWMGFLQAWWQDRYGPLKACLLVTIPFALFHLPVLFVDEGLALALALLPPLAVVHLAARVVMAWLYNSTGRSVLLVGLFHSSFDAAVWYAKRSTPGPAGTATYVGFAIVLAAAVVLVVATRGRLSYRPSLAVPPTGAPRRATAATGATPSPDRIV
jgi:membrane protease YdiL (CAAX protease family)